MKGWFLFNLTTMGLFLHEETFLMATQSETAANLRYHMIPYLRWARIRLSPGLIPVADSSPQTIDSVARSKRLASTKKQMQSICL